MKPELCFLLCETPIIYIKDKVCRCSGNGLTANNKAECDEKETYSAYVENEFYSQHAHLFNYQVLFTSCELWNKSNVYDTFQVKIEKSSVKSSLNQLERCAAACLDRYPITKSIAFNGDNKQCLCILPQNLTKILNNTFYSTILSNDSCNHYCDNRLSDSNVKNKFKCGSSTDSRIWAVYSLNQTCPINSFYIEELNECIYIHETVFSEGCPSSTTKYVYDGSVKWDIFLKAIEKLNLTKSDVDIDFDDDVTIDPSWKCLTKRAFDTEDSDNDDSTSNAQNIRSNYVLKNGCLRLRPSSSSYSFYSDRRTRNYLCIPNRLNDFSSSSYTGLSRYYDSDSYISWHTCPSDWLDLNRNCYRISENHKTIQKARNRCFNFSEDALKNIKVPFISSYYSHDKDDDYDDDKDEMMNISRSIMIDTLKGEIVQYTYEWEARLGFYLLDQTRGIKINSSFVNEFQMINRNEENNSSIKDDSCLIVSRTKMNETKDFIIQNTQINNCSQSRYVLCKTKPTLDFSFKIGCFNKPLTLDLPAMISNHLTYELCLSICKNFKANLAVINMNKCYCLNADRSSIHYLRSNNTKFATKDCGNPCSGNRHETCGNTNTIVALREDESIYRPSYLEIYEQHKQYSNFLYQNCIDLSSTNESGIYEFNFTRMSDIHPRHCVELCAYYKQQYSLLNSNKCLCTNILMENMKADPITSSRTTTLRNDNCTQQCPANYFYTCGNINNSNIYSVYSLEFKCPFGFRITEDEQRCVHTNYSTDTKSFSTAQSYCKSIGGILVKINDILDIQDIVSKYTLTRYLEETESYFWIDRTLDIMKKKKKPVRSIERCFQTSKSIDQNCIVVRREKIIVNDVLSNSWCLTESDQCSSMSAVPICVDRQFELNSIQLPQQTTNDNSSIVSFNISTDYSCQNDEDYHFIDGHCYKVLFHESTWNNARIQCERDNAILFLPEKSTKLQLIKSLLLRHHSYTTSSYLVHVGMFYDNQTRIITQYNGTDESILTNMSYIYDIDEICKRKVNERFELFMSSPVSSIYGKDRTKTRKIKCAYIDFKSEYKQSISCGVKSCNRLATVICQKPPIVITQTIYAKIDYTNFPMNDKSNRALKSRKSTVTILSLIVTILFVLIIIGLIYALRKRYSQQNNNNTHRTTRLNSECTYSKLLIKNESDPI